MVDTKSRVGCFTSRIVIVVHSELSNVALQRLAHSTTDKGRSPASPLQALVRLRCCFFAVFGSGAFPMTIFVEGRKPLITMDYSATVIRFRFFQRLPLRGIAYDSSVNELFCSDIGLTLD